MLLKISPQPVEWLDEVSITKSHKTAIRITLVKRKPEFFCLSMTLLETTWGHMVKTFYWQGKTLEEVITVGENVLNDWKNQIEITGGVMK